MANSDTHQELHDLFNGRDFDGIAKRMTDRIDYVDHAAGLTVRTPAEFKAWLESWTRIMPNAQCTQGRYLDCGDTSVALFVGRGRNDGELAGHPPTGLELSFPLCEVLTYNAEGAITGGEIYFDRLTLLTQAGHSPA